MKTNFFLSEAKAKQKVDLGWKTFSCSIFILLACSREGWEARALLGFFEAKRRAKENVNRQLRSGRRPPPRRRRYVGGARLWCKCCNPFSFQVLFPFPSKEEKEVRES